MGKSVSKDINKKQRIANKKHTKLTYGERLAVPNNYTGVRLELAKTEPDKLEKQRGRKSFSEKAIELGVFDDITDSIEYFVICNPYFNQEELMKYLMSEFPDVFSNVKTKYPQNFYKNIERVDDWREALATPIKPMEDVLRNLHKYVVAGRREVVDHNGDLYEIGAKASDQINYIKLQLLLEDREKAEQAKEQEKETASNSGVIFTFDDNEDGDTND